MHDLTAAGPNDMAEPQHAAWVPSTVEIFVWGLTEKFDGRRQCYGSCCLPCPGRPRRRSSTTVWFIDTGKSSEPPDRGLARAIPENEFRLQYSTSNHSRPLLYSQSSLVWCKPMSYPTQRDDRAAPPTYRTLTNWSYSPTHIDCKTNIRQIGPLRALRPRGSRRNVIAYAHLQHINHGCMCVSSPHRQTIMCFYRTTLYRKAAKRGMCNCNFVRPSVRPSHSWIVSSQNGVTYHHISFTAKNSQRFGPNYIY